MTPHAPLTHRGVWALALPMILSGISQPLLGLVDTAVVGHLPDARYLGGVAVGAMLVQFVFWQFGFLRMSTTGFAAQALGREDGDELRAVLGRALLAGLALALLILLLQAPLMQAALALVGAGETVTPEAQRYVDIRIWAAPAALANYAFIGWFIGLHRTRSVLVLVVVMNLANIALDLLFVVVLGHRSGGVALASLLAEYLGLAVAIGLALRLLRAHPGRWRRDLLVDRAALLALFRVNRDIFLRTLGLLFAFAFFTVQGARLGELTVAANAVLMNFQSFMAYALDGFAHAAEALVGRTVGRRDRAAFRRAVWLAGLWSFVAAAGFALVYLLAGPAIIRLLTDLPLVRETAMAYLPWLVLTPLVSVWAFLLDGVFIGATRAREMRNAMLVSVFMIYLPSWYLLRPFDNHGLWLALLLFLAARGLTLYWIYRRQALAQWFEPAPAQPMGQA